MKLNQTTIFTKVYYSFERSEANFLEQVTFTLLVSFRYVFQTGKRLGIRYARADSDALFLNSGEFLMQIPSSFLRVFDGTSNLIKIIIIIFFNSQAKSTLALQFFGSTTALQPLFSSPQV